MYDAIVKLYTYRNLQRHRVVYPAIARLSCSEIHVPKTWSYNVAHFPPEGSSSLGLM